MVKIVKIVEYKEQYRITIPKVLVQIRNWKAGTKLGITQLPDGSIVLKEVKDEDKAETGKNEEPKKKRKG